MTLLFNYLQKINEKVMYWRGENISRPACYNIDFIPFFGFEGDVFYFLLNGKKKEDTHVFLGVGKDGELIKVADIIYYIFSDTLVIDRIHVHPETNDTDLKICINRFVEQVLYYSIQKSVTIEFNREIFEKVFNHADLINEIFDREGIQTASIKLKAIDD